MSILVYSCGECILTPTSGSMNSQSPMGDVVIYRLIHLHLLHWSTIVIVTGYLSFHAYYFYLLHALYLCDAHARGSLSQRRLADDVISLADWLVLSGRICWGFKLDVCWHWQHPRLIRTDGRPNVVSTLVEYAVEFIEDHAVIYEEINEDVAEILLFIFSWFESHPVIPVREFVCATPVFPLGLQTFSLSSIIWQGKPYT